MKFSLFDNQCLHYDAYGIFNQLKAMENPKLTLGMVLHC